MAASLIPSTQRISGWPMVLFLLLRLPAPAQDAPAPVLATARARVLDRQECATENGTLTFERIVPPVLPARVPVAAEPPPLTREEVASIARREAKTQRLLQVSATVIDQRVTFLRWSDGQTEFHAVSNVDFRYLCGLDEIETTDTVFRFLMGYGDETFTEEERASGALRQRLAEFGLERLPEPHEFPSAAPCWRLLRTRPARFASETTPAAIDALHAHYAAHRAELEKGWQQREATRLEAERQRREHPDPPEHLIIRFWREPSAPIPSRQP